MTEDDWNRAYCLMDIADNKAVQQLTAVRDSVIRKIQEQQQTEMTDDEKIVFGSFIRLLLLDLRHPYRKGSEECLPYLEGGDVKEWCRLIERMLPRIDEFLSNPDKPV